MNTEQQETTAVTAPTTTTTTTTTSSTVDDKPSAPQTENDLATDRDQPAQELKPDDLVVLPPVEVVTETQPSIVNDEQQQQANNTDENDPLSNARPAAKRGLAQDDENTTTTTTTTTTIQPPNNNNNNNNNRPVVIATSRRRLNSNHPSTAIPPTTGDDTPAEQKDAPRVINTKSSAQKLILQQYRELVQNPPGGIGGVELDGNNIFKWKVVIIGPADTPYNGGIFPCMLSFPHDYPAKPPVFQFLTPNFVHPNVFPDGRVCISILHDPTDRIYDHEPASERWKPILGVEAILLSIVSLLSEPNLDSPANVDIAKIYQNDQREYRKRIVMMVRKTQQQQDQGN